MLQRPRFRTAPLAAVPSIRRHPCAPYSRFAGIVGHLQLKRIKEEKARVSAPQLVTCSQTDESAVAGHRPLVTSGHRSPGAIRRSSE